MIPAFQHPDFLIICSVIIICLPDGIDLLTMKCSIALKGAVPPWGFAY